MNCSGVTNLHLGVEIGGSLGYALVLARATPSSSNTASAGCTNSSSNE